jgi:hypothetical protein
MRQALLLVLVISMLSGCFGMGGARTDRADNPCEDARYVELQEKDLEEMTEREYAYYLQKTDECSRYRETHLMSDPARRGMSMMNTLIIVSLAGSAALTLLALVLRITNRCLRLT